MQTAGFGRRTRASKFISIAFYNRSTTSDKTFCHLAFGTKSPVIAGGESIRTAPHRRASRGLLGKLPAAIKTGIAQ
jgi:hypothetical protein